jgi:hypothetical protein
LLSRATSRQLVECHVRSLQYAYVMVCVFPQPVAPYANTVAL